MYREHRTLLAEVDELPQSTEGIPPRPKGILLDWSPKGFGWLAVIVALSWVAVGLVFALW